MSKVTTGKGLHLDCMILGQSIFGHKNWNRVRPGLVAMVTDGQALSSKDLTMDQAKALRTYLERLAHPDRPEADPEDYSAPRSVPEPPEWILR